MNKLLLAPASFAFLLLTGCASIGSGDSEYGCKGLPEGVQCMSAREVYGLTEEPGPVRADPKSIEEDGGASDAKAKSTLLSRLGKGGEGSSSGAANESGYQGDPLFESAVSGEPIPIRSRAKIMRIWVSPWEAKNGDLNGSGLIFTELEERRWNIGTQEDVEPVKLSPLQRTLEAVRKKDSGSSSSK